MKNIATLKHKNIFLLFVVLMLCFGVSQASAQAEASIKSMITRSDEAITQRIGSLSALATRINSMQKLSEAQKSIFAKSLQNEISKLTALKATIDADTTASALRVDMQTITKSYRTYALILPQTNIAATSDRILTIVGLMSGVQSKLQARVAQIVNPSVSITSAMTDATKKMADATTQANAAIAEISSLAPDGGNTTIATSNMVALKNARDKIKTAMADLQIARKDLAVFVFLCKSIDKGFYF